ncbi:MAG TPA: hypothetical protein VFJ85_03940 [Acidimicrobiales bacterium]|nr:hypothetical protein [Acidimicrobiales bacterium]
MHRRTKVLTISGGVLAALLLAASAAFACVSLATLDLSPGKGAAGTTVKGDLTNFQNTAGHSDITVRWGKADGQILAVVPKPTAPSNSASFTFTVPADAAPGTYAVLATQLDPNGVPTWGSPARAIFTVPGVAAGVAPAPEAAPAPETVTVEQKYIVNGEATPAPAAAPAAPAPAVRPAPAKAAPAAPAPAVAAAPSQPTQVLSLEAQDAITEKVAPVGSRTRNIVPATSRLASSSNNAMHLGIALAVIGTMALLTAAGAAYILRPTPARVKR